MSESTSWAEMHLRTLHAIPSYFAGELTDEGLADALRVLEDLKEDVMLEYSKREQRRLPRNG